MRCWAVYCPLSFVVVVTDVPFVTSVTVIVAFGTTAPLLSVTVPIMDPYTACPSAGRIVIDNHSRSTLTAANVDAAFESLQADNNPLILLLMFIGTPPRAFRGPLYEPPNAQTQQSQELTALKHRQSHTEQKTAWC